MGNLDLAQTSECKNANVCAIDLSKILRQLNLHSKNASILAGVPMLALELPLDTCLLGKWSAIQAEVLETETFCCRQGLSQNGLSPRPKEAGSIK